MVSQSNPSWGWPRWLHSVGVTTIMAMVAIALFLEKSTVHASPVILDESDGGSELAIGVTTKAAEAVNTCTDDPHFEFRGKNCVWVEKVSSKRCNRKVRGKFIAESCRESCDYQYCKTIQDNQSKLSVGVYYYPWWGDDFHRGGNPDNPQLYLRRQLYPQQFPSMGEYDDRKKNVIGKHLDWSRKFNINLWVTSWWGEGRREDLTIKNHILVHNQLRNHRIAIFYETTGRILEKENYDLGNVKSDLKYLCQQYFHHSNYFTIGVDEEGNADASSQTRVPVLFVYLTRKLEDLGLLTNVINLMREGAKEGGCEKIFIVGDQVFQGPPKNNEENIPFDLLDAVTNYDVYGSMRGEKHLGYIGSRENVTKYYEEQNQWRAMAKDRDCAFIPAVSPGYNDRGVRPEENRIPLSRRLNRDSSEGSLFRAALEEARTIVDPVIGNLIMVNSWNEYHEDTQIEPIHAVDNSKKTTNLPNELTYGINYKAYGNLYLKILKDETRKWDPSMVVPPPSLGAVDEKVSPPKNEGNEEEVYIISDSNQQSLVECFVQRKR